VATIYVDGKAYEVDPGRNLLETCLSLGFNLPYFCWHPAMGSVGACRQCAVKQFRDATQQQGRLVMACMTPAADGTRISIADPEAAAFRAGVIQGLMQNHPHDCPVCDEGGECHLQDMTMMTGHDYRLYSFDKRTFRNQYLGPLVNHEMNRCIQCYRCVRFYREYAGGRDLNAFALRNTVFFGRDADGILESEFSGNLVEVCPTGVFTDATLKHHYTRKWDLQMAPSVCVHCSLGCNVTAGERYGLLRRIVNRYNRAVNGYFLCDRGRYGYEFVNSSRRIRTPLVRRDGVLEPVSSENAVASFARLLSEGARSIGIGSPRASIEANFALRALVGPDRFFAGVSDDRLSLLSAVLAILTRSPAPIASLHDVERSDAVLILGEDVTNSAPRMALSLRQSVRQQPLRSVEKLRIPAWLDHAVREVIQDRKGPLFLATPAATKLDEIATTFCRAAPGDIARLGFAVAHAIDRDAPPVPGNTSDLQALATQVAAALGTAERPLVVAGTGCHDVGIVQAAANVAGALRKAARAARIALLVPECNSVGLTLLQPRPLGEALHALERGRADTVVVLENDLFHRAPASVVEALLRAARHVVAVDHVENRTTARAEIVLPAATFAEADGTLVSNEGRAQRFFQALDPGQVEGGAPGQGLGNAVQESWRWLRDVMLASGRTDVSWATLDDVIDAIAGEIPALSAIREAAPPASFRMAGDRIPREPRRYSGRTAMRAAISVHEPDPPDDLDSPLAFSMEGNPTTPPAPLTPFFWWPAWNSIQAVKKFQEEVNGPLRGGDAGVRMFDADAGARHVVPLRPGYFDTVPPKSTHNPGEWLVVPLYHIFGSDELSALSPAIAGLSPRAYVALNSGDARRLGVANGQEAVVSVGDAAYRLPVAINASLPDGVAGLPRGLPPLDGVVLPARARIERVP
jgi:NADH-quinone oxidoreductase subunit G